MELNGLFFITFSQNSSPPPSPVGPYNPPAEPLRPAPGPFLSGQQSDNTDRRRVRRSEDEPIGQRTGPKNRYGTKKKHEFFATSVPFRYKISNMVCLF